MLISNRRKGSFSYAISCLMIALSLFYILSSTLFSQTTEFLSPNGVKEKCIAIKKFPGAENLYTQADLKKEAKYCSIDFYSDTTALCPKFWSTSPATMLYDISQSPLTQSEYEATRCRSRRNHEKLVKFKQTMNQEKTSATFSTSSLLYYHFSRYFNFETHVPVSVYRTMDIKQHYERVSKKAIEMTKNNGDSSRIKHGWLHLEKAAKDPNSYRPVRELFTAQKDQIYGIFIRGKGERYGAELNGVRGGWGKQDNLDFQKTFPFMALKEKSSLLTSIQLAKKKASEDQQLLKETGDVSDIQMVYWMKELLEITLVDYIFSQQDRIGNLDYLWFWQWKEAEEIKSRRVKEKSLKDLPRTEKNKIKIPQDLLAFSPVLLQRSQLNDNDAGGRIPYANFAKKTNMLEDLRHYNKSLYEKLILLDEDLQKKGEVYQYLSLNFPLSSKQLKQIVDNVKLAKDILQNSCKKGDLKFDVEPQEFFLNGHVIEQVVDC